MIPDLDSRQLEAFVAVLATGSITAAAQQLGRSQPGVTRQIQDLEAALGFPLLERSGRRVVPTERAARFRVEVERHLAGLLHLRSRAEAILRGEEASLDIAAIPAFAAGLITRAVAALTHDKPVATHLRAVGGEEVVRLVLGRIADIGLCSLPVQSPGLTMRLVIEAPCVAVLPEADPLAHHAVLPLAALAGRRLITTAHSYRLRRHVDEALREVGLSRQVPLDTNTSFSALGAVRAGLGIALVEPLTPAGAPIAGLVTRPIDRHLPFLYGAFTATGRPLTPLLTGLLDELRRMLPASVPGLRVMEPEEETLRDLIEDSAEAELVR